MAEYASIDELQVDIGLDDNANIDRDTLERLLNAAEYSINRMCNRPSGFLSDSTASARYYSGRGEPYVMIDECTAITTVSVKDSATDASYVDWDSPTSDMAGDGDWIPFTYDPRTPNFNAGSEGRPYTWLMVDPNGDYSVFTNGRYLTQRGFSSLNRLPRSLPTVKVTAKWGFASTVPADIKMVTIMQAARWYKRLQGGMSDAIANPEFGTLRYIQELDPDVKHVLYGGRYVRPSI